LNVRRSLELSADEVQKNLEEGKPSVVRLLVPRDETVAIDDIVRGHVQWDCSLIADPVIVRGNGSPLYNFATVIDDSQMQISHVIRAEEHLTNTSVQALIYQALGYDFPEFAHIPYVASPGSKEKLSKRDKKIEKYRKMPQFKKMFEAADNIFPKIGLGSSETLNPVMVEYYERIGYLPDAIFNSLSRLGWSYDDKTENMTRQFIVENFTLDRVVKSSAGLDPDKLISFQAHWMGELSAEEKLAGCLPYLIAAGTIPAEPDETCIAFVGKLIEKLDDRVKLFSDILDYDEYFIADAELMYEEKAFRKRLLKSPDSVELLKKYAEQLKTAEPFDADSLDKHLHDFVEAEETGMGQIIHALRVSTTGKSSGPGMFDCLELLGRERCLNRINRALQLLEDD